MAAAGCHLYQDYRKMAFMGFAAVLRHMGTILRSICAWRSSAGNTCPTPRFTTISRLRYGHGNADGCIRSHTCATKCSVSFLSNQLSIPVTDMNAPMSVTRLWRNVQCTMYNVPFLRPRRLLSFRVHAKAKSVIACRECWRQHTVFRTMPSLSVPHRGLTRLPASSRVPLDRLTVGRSDPMGAAAVLLYTVFHAGEHHRRQTGDQRVHR